MSQDQSEYEVGYGKPPKATQFKKGQSGNPRGRPKMQPKDVAAHMSDLLAEKRPVRVDGKTVMMSGEVGSTADGEGTQGRRKGL
ncbi:MAG: hypothetical protein JKP95_01895 [Oceanicaulis sp.]|nr:hypothetical protein [Oceanicaulis sp.]